MRSLFLAAILFFYWSCSRENEPIIQDGIAHIGKYSSPIKVIVNNEKVDFIYTKGLLGIYRDGYIDEPIWIPAEFSKEGYWLVKYGAPGKMIIIPTIIKKENEIWILREKESAQQVDAPEPATMIFSAWQHNIGRPGDL